MNREKALECLGVILDYYIPKIDDDAEYIAEIEAMENYIIKNLV